MASGYVNLRYKPRKSDLVALYYVESSRNITVQKASEHVAAESSIGTWTDVLTMSKNIREKLQAKVFDISGNYVKISYPIDLFEPGNVPQLMSSVGGNIFGMRAVQNLKLLDIHLPKKYIDSFKGPEFGVQGIRNLTKVRKRPLLGTIVKPKVGLNAEEHARVAYESWVGGLDIVKDDENLSSLNFNKFEERVKKTLEMRVKAEKETKEVKVYMPNVTAESNEMIERAKFVKRQGGRYVMIDIITAGWAALQTLRSADLGLCIHAHRAGHAAFTRSERHGISMLVIAKLARLIGVDQLHIGAIIAKMHGSMGEVLQVEEELEKKFVGDTKTRLKQEWHGIKPVMAVASGGLYPGSLPPLIRLMGNDIVAQFGGGVHGHPNGSKNGARAVRQAVDAVTKGILLKEYAKEHEELKKAIDKWGILR